jgi:hypothetical protein
LKTVEYLGPHEGVIIPLPSGFSYECERNGTVELPDDLAEELVARGDWKLAKTSKKTTKSAKDEE